jgi:dTDP-4-dehydrorhamnose reductase
MNVLVLGENGQLARSLQERMPDATYLGRTSLDLEDLGAIQPRIVDEHPDFIVNAAAYTAVDAAETDRERAWRLNADAAGEIAAVALRLRIPLLHVSTDYVFGGDRTNPYREDDPVAPLNVYGSSKLHGERAVATRAGPEWWIFRTSSVFSAHGHNFVKTMLRLAREGKSLRVVVDQVSRPTYAGHVADVVVQTISKYRTHEPLPSGIYHCASTGAASWFQLAQVTLVRATELGLLSELPEIKPIAASEYPTAAARPRYSVLDTSRLENALDWQIPRWQEGVEATLHELAP